MLNIIKKRNGNPVYPLGVIKYTQLPPKQLADLLSTAVSPLGFVREEYAPSRPTMDAGMSIKFAGYFVQADIYDTLDGVKLRLTDFPGDPSEPCPPVEPCPPIEPCPPCPPSGDVDCCDPATGWCTPTLKVSPSCEPLADFSTAMLNADDVPLEDFVAGKFELEAPDGGTQVTF